MTDGLLFASHHSNVLPAPAPMSINGRHVPKHIQHTKRTLWLEEMDCAQDWQGTLWMCQSSKALCFTAVPSFNNKEVSFCLICLCVQYNYSHFLYYIWLKNIYIFFKAKTKSIPVLNQSRRGNFVKQVRVEFTILCSVQHAFVKALIYAFHDMLMRRAGAVGGGGG